MLLQVIVLLLQEFLGPRFFIPQKFLPPTYNYKRAISSEGIQCVICMNDVSTLNDDYMVTPCDHLFHSDCLLKWMEEKIYPLSSSPGRVQTSLKI